MGSDSFRAKQRTQTNSLRMRDEKTFKLRANHSITPSSELKEHKGNENCFCWGAEDFTDGTYKHETFGIKFISESKATREREANEFKEFFEHSIKENCEVTD